MAISPNPGHLYVFGPFRLDAEQLLLFQGEHRVALPPKDLQMLLLLLESRGRIVEKAELLEKVWPGTFIEEGNLAKHISTLRQALGDEKNGGDYIETIPRRGYRFVGQVEVLSQEPVPIQPSSAKPAETVEVPRSRRWLAVAASVLIPALLAFGYLGWRARGSSPAPPDRVVLAVLPIENYSGDPGQDYFADGLTEELITQLSQFSPKHLRIIARSSTMKYKGARKAASEIGNELGVDYLIEGSIRKDHDRMRISAQFIQVKDQTQLWAQDYDFDITGLTAMQDDVARTIAQEVRLSLTPASSVSTGTRRTENPRAYEAYLRGRYHWNLRTGDGLWKSLKYFQQALEIEPTYPLAYVGLADSYILLGNYEFMDTTEALPRAQAAAHKALELDDKLAEAHTSLAFTHFHYDYDWTAAEKEFLRALELNPSYATAHQWYAEFLATMGRHAEAHEQIVQARQLDPLSVPIQNNVGRLAFMAGRYDEAITELRRVLALDQNNLWAHEFLWLSLAEKGLVNEAIADNKYWVRLAPDPGKPSITLAYCYARAGRRKESKKLLTKLIGVTGHEGADAFFIAGVFAALGGKDEAFMWLQRARVKRSFFLPFISFFPWFDPLRADPRFHDLLRQMNLPASSTQESVRPARIYAMPQPTQ